MQNNFLIYNDLEQIYQQFIETAIPKIVNSSEKQIRISIDNLLNMPASRSILFEILSTYGFNPSQVNQIHSEIRHLQTGKTFFSEDYCIVKNRNDLILEQIRQEQSTPVILSEHLRSISYPISLYIEYQEYTANFKFENNKNIAYFDADKISFPLLIRNKQQGDYFYPFGMKGKKLISDYYTDIKLSLFEKEKTFLLVSAEEIIWVIGYRTDNRFKVSKNTQTILKISCNSV
jgi:tRNA(Ile)-lysidine synthase